MEILTLRDCLCSGCCVTESHRPGGPEAVEAHEQPASLGGRGLLPGCRFLFMSTQGKGLGAPVLLSVRVLIRFTRLCFHGLITSPGPSVFIPSPWGLGFTRMNSLETQTFRPQQGLTMTPECIHSYKIYIFFKTYIEINSIS